MASGAEGGNDKADNRLLKADLRIYTAFAQAMHAADLLTESELKAIREAAKTLESEMKGIGPTRDRLAELDRRLAAITPAAAKPAALMGYTERTLTALRLYLMDALEGLTEQIAALQKTLIEQAEGQVGALMPGYAYGQPAEIVSCSHFLLATFWAFARDLDRLASVVARASSLPLGSGRLSGVPHRLDRRELADALGFADAAPNSVDATNDIDFAAEFLFVAGLLATHLSRFAEDVLRLSSPALGFLSLDDDPAEIGLPGLRSLAATLNGSLLAALGSMNSLPTTADLDLNGVTTALQNAVDALESGLEVAELTLAAINYNPDRMLEALDFSLLTPDLRDYLIGQGADPAEADQHIAALMAKAEKNSTPIPDMELSSLQAISPHIDEGVFGVFDYTRVAARRASMGGTAPAAIRAQIRQAMDWLVEAGLE